MVASRQAESTQRGQDRIKLNARRTANTLSQCLQYLLPLQHKTSATGCSLKDQTVWKAVKPPLK